MSDIVFLSQPYHRGGVTQWMANAFNYWDRSKGDAYFLSVKPRKRFISGGSRPLIFDLLDNQFANKVFFKTASTSFELGTIEYRANIYRELILRSVPKRAFLIPSDDEACWLAAASLAASYRMIGVLHADESVYYQLAKKYANYIHCFVCVSKRIHQTLIDQLPSANAISTVIPCGIPTTSFKNTANKKNQIAWIGRLGRYQKRAQDIPLIWNEVNSQSRDTTFKVIGHGDFSADLDQYIRGLEDPNRFINVGWISPDEVRKILAETKVFLQTSDFEGMSVALMEALASGCRVVSTRVSGAEDLEGMPEADKVISLYKAGDCDTAAQLVVKAIESYNEDSRKGAQQLAKELFDISITNARLFSFLNKIAPVSMVNLSLPRIQILLSPIVAYLRWIKWKLVS